MHTARVLKLLLIALVAIQLGSWAVIGRSRLVSVAAESFFAVMRQRALENDWDESGELPRHSLQVANSHAAAVGPDRIKKLRAVAEQHNQEIVFVDDWNGDRFCYVEAVNTPAFSRVKVGWLGKSCASMGKTDFLYLAGFWIELPRS